MFSVNCVINNDQTIQPLRDISKCNVALIFCCNEFAMLYDRFAVTLSVKVEILQEKLL